jgi:hypothetical protein
MADLPEDLRAAVEAQAKARLEMNIQGYAKYLTPEAVDSLRSSYQGIPPRVSRFEIDSSDAAGAEYVVEVRYHRREESFVVRSRWRRDGDAWMVTHAERVWAEGEARPGLFARWLARVTGRLVRRRR